MSDDQRGTVTIPRKQKVIAETICPRCLILQTNLTQERAMLDWWMKHRASLVTTTNGEKMLMWHWTVGESPLSRNQFAWKKVIGSFDPDVVRRATREAMEGK